MANEKLQTIRDKHSTLHKVNARLTDAGYSATQAARQERDAQRKHNDAVADFNAARRRVKETRLALRLAKRNHRRKLDAMRDTFSNDSNERMDARRALNDAFDAAKSDGE